MMGESQSRSAHFGSDAGVSDAGVVDRLFRTYDTLTPDLLGGGGSVLLVSAFGPQAACLRAWVEELGAVGVILEEHQLAAIWQAVCAYRTVCIVLDESYLGAEDTLSTIWHIRRWSVDLPVVVLSSHVALCRFEPERAWPADVVLRLPVSRTSIKLGVVSAISNREITQHLPQFQVPPARPAAAERFRSWIWQTSGNAVRALIGGGRL